MKYPIAVMMTILTGLSSCTNFIEEEEPVSFGVNVSELSYDTGSSFRPVIINSGTKWTVSSMPSWMNLVSISPSGTCAYEWIADFWAEDNNDYDREGEIGISSSPLG